MCADMTARLLDGSIQFGNRAVQIGELGDWEIPFQVG